MTSPAPPPARDDDRDFGVLFVCTGNLCRSPMAQVLFDRVVARTWSGSGHWRAESAGVAAADGQSMHPHALTVLGELGADGSQFRSRRLRRSMLESADLVLTATRAQRSAVAQLYPRALARLFTVNQFAYLLTHAPPLNGQDDARAAGGALLAAARTARSLAPARTEEDDLDDPINRPLNRFREVGQIVRADLDAVVRALRSVGG